MTNVVVRCSFKAWGVKGFGSSTCAPVGLLHSSALHKMPVQVVPPPSPDELPELPQQYFYFMKISLPSCSHLHSCLKAVNLCVGCKS